MIDLLEQIRTDLQTWIWQKCPSCDSTNQPSIESGSMIGGYQETIVLKCPDCNMLMKFTSDWSPILEVPLVNAVPELVETSPCPFLSIQKKDDQILLRCCSNNIRDCFGRPKESCYSFHAGRLADAILVIPKIINKPIAKGNNLF